ncbi:hypothetical protein [Mucilaginibacter sp.]|uniref:hypothetical protein n=1 Tax=Mucilaginibacter sp. TaxID=1882438 RepID=UPI0025F17896|nr:hypothetical protein [Mucilaginibacter sp.]
MIIDKKNAVAFLVCNIVLVAIHIFLHVYLSDTVFGIKALRPGTYISFWLIIAFIEILLRLTISLGIFWILKVFKEKTWIRVVFSAFFVWQIGTVLSFGISNKTLSGFIAIIYYATIVLLILLIAAFSSMRARRIKAYLIWFAMLTLFVVALPHLGAQLYDNFGSKWLLINQRVLARIPTLATLILFITVYNISRSKFDVNEVNPAI